MDDILIRAGEPKDAADLRDIYAAPENYSATLQLPYPDLTTWEKRTDLSNPPTLRLVAEVEHKVVGDICLMQLQTVRMAHVARLGMAVHVEFQHRGIGQRLLKEAIDYAFLWLNIERIELEVYPDNTAAIALYKKMGFEQEGVKRRAVFRAGRYVDVNIMALLRE
ncbi:L-amino acid N-acetyltransferase AaaT [Halomonadaceae bacterium LMG 33818]|uniref:GNAT family N-acetyltransferase n=1 Tax=Cernens ardua TaxID=3402176 RepID=UPI003EDBEE52